MANIHLPIMPQITILLVLMITSKGMPPSPCASLVVVATSVITKWERMLEVKEPTMSNRPMRQRIPQRMAGLTLASDGPQE